MKKISSMSLNYFIQFIPLWFGMITDSMLKNMSGEWHVKKMMIFRHYFPKGIDSKSYLIHKSQIFGSSPHGGGCFLCTVTTAAPYSWEVRWSPLALSLFPPPALFWLAAESTRWQPGWDGALPAAQVLGWNTRSHTMWGIHTDGMCCSCANQHFHFLQLLVGDLKVLWHNTEGQ